jgi:hypothetical protein
MSFDRTRIYYRNPFLHIGHLNTLYHNQHIVKGTCYAIIDDRQNRDRIMDIKEDFEYLGLNKIEIVSVLKRRQEIMNYTEDLIVKKHIYIHYCNSIETNPEKIMQHLTNPQMHFQLKLKCSDVPNIYTDPSVGYTKIYPTGLSVVLIFDYIIKVLDSLLNITDIVSTNTTDVADVKDQLIANFFDKQNGNKICYHRLDTYFIHGFKYSKKNWPMMDERDPYLLTIKGLKARHVPQIILHAFYLHATQIGSIRISYLGNLLRAYFNQSTNKVLAVLNPLKIELTNWKPHRTEYVCKSVGSDEMELCPLSNILYMEQSDYGIDVNRLTKGRICRLRYGPTIKCTDVELDDRGPVLIKAEILDKRETRSVHWISSEWGQDPVRVKFYLYNWFFTGHNVHQSPRISYGYIDKSVFKDLTKVYQLEHNGYYVYDTKLSHENSIPSFICICKIKN